MGENRGKNARKIIVALSGGVDSSVAAALLKRAGFSVSAVFMKLSDSSLGSEKMAGKVAKNLDIPFHIFDFRKKFRKEIIETFLSEYRKGLTPNPCVLCNKEIKFGLLIKEGLKIGAEYLATGHYVRTKEKKGKVSLLKGTDKEKDQSYFLWRLSQKELKRVLFPVGNYTKSQVKSLAKDFKLPTVKASESQEICFIPNDINSFLKKHIKPRPGKIVNKEGKVLADHPGLVFYTIGQRKGLNLPGGPFFVVNKDFKKNLLVVSKNENDLLKKEMTVKKVSWVSEKPKFPLKVKVKIRYRHLGVDSLLKLSENKLRVVFKTPQRAVTPGQSAVFYKGEELLGGGIIC